MKNNKHTVLVSLARAQHSAPENLLDWGHQESLLFLDIAQCDTHSKSTLAG